jgi:citrate lyase subunit beta/citryl-CoA lyase
MKKIEKILSGLEKTRKLKPIQIIPSIESAEGVVNTFSIASFGKRVSAIVFGVFDLLNDLGIEYTKEPEGAKYSRAKIPVDAHAAGVAAIDAIWQDLKDSKGFEKDCKIGKSLGFSGKSIIHPDQIPVVHKLFHPNKSEILWAEKVCKTYLKSTKKGKGATTVDGKMIDEVHFKQAKALLELVKQS